MSLDYEIRNDPVDNPENLDDATRAVNELRTAAEAFQTRMDERLATETRAMNERLAAIETRLNRPGSGGARNDNEPTHEQRAFTNYLRRGVAGMDPVEVRTLAVGTNNAGGFLVPYQFLREIDRNLVLFSPIRSVARIQPVSEGDIRLPQRTANMTASWEGELDPEPSAQPTYGQKQFTVYEQKCYVDISLRLLEDAAFNMDAEIAFDIAQEFARAEGAAFVGGDGTLKPLGIINDTSITAGVTTASPTAIVADEIIQLFYSLPTPYAQRATWAMNRTTMAMIRQLKTSIGTYIWQESLADGQPPTIMGRPVIEFPDMPNPAATTNPIVFGSFGDGFRIFDRVGLSILRDDYSQRTNSLVRFHARRRVGGGVSKGEALRFLTMHA